MFCCQSRLTRSHRCSQDTPEGPVYRYEWTWLPTSRWLTREMVLESALATAGPLHDAGLEARIHQRQVHWAPYRCTRSN